MAKYKSFTKSDLIQAVHSQFKSLSQKQAKQSIQHIFDYLTESLSNKKRIEIRGFGSFGLKKYKARPGKNPQTGKTIQVPAKTLPFFKAGKLKESVSSSKK